MALVFQPVTLDGASPDRAAALVFRDGRLTAVLTCLGDIHAEMADKWFIEAMFGDAAVGHNPVFDSKQAFEEWLTDAIG